MLNIGFGIKIVFTMSENQEEGSPKLINTKPQKQGDGRIVHTPNLPNPEEVLTTYNEKGLKRHRVVPEKPEGGEIVDTQA